MQLKWEDLLDHLIGMPSTKSKFYQITSPTTTVEFVDVIKIMIDVYRTFDDKVYWY